MCGIAGTVMSGDAVSALLDSESPAFRSIRSRGPDSHGCHAFRHRNHSVTLAHSRLAVIDLTKHGHQPMHEPGSGWWISYNGELYNYREMRDDLRALGWQFHTASDTEVLLKAWAQWGLHALSRCNGMFAVAFYQASTGQLWLLRDRFGVKPLAWARRSDGGVLFSSSIAALAREAGDEIDIGYCSRGLRYKVFENGRAGSPFRHVHTVTAGGWVRIDLQASIPQISEGCWYSLQDQVAARSDALSAASDATLLEQCRTLLDDAVQLRLRSDVPVAVSLSGGLDSSTVAALAAQQVDRLRGFCYGSPHAPESEGAAVHEFAEATGVAVEYVWPRFNAAGLDDALERTLQFQEAPFPGLSLIAQNEVYRHAARAGYRVLLGGQGGDEIFAGYRKFFIVAVRQAVHRREPMTAMRLLYSLGLMLTHEARQLHMYWENIDRYRPGKQGRFALLDWHPETENLWGDNQPSLSARQIADVQQWSLPTLLRYEDRNSMGYGIESRLPMMDYRLVELALAMPARLKIRNGYGKWALRQVTSGRVPDAIRQNRKKRGFDVTQAWVSAGVGAALRQRIFNRRHALADYVVAGADLDSLLSDVSLAADTNLLDEALMLAWLSEPVRSPVFQPTSQASYA